MEPRNGNLNPTQMTWNTVPKIGAKDEPLGTNVRTGDLLNRVIGILVRESKALWKNFVTNKFKNEEGDGATVVPKTTKLFGEGLQELPFDMFRASANNVHSEPLLKTRVMDCLPYTLTFKRMISSKALRDLNLFKQAFYEIQSKPWNGNQRVDYETLDPISIEN